MRLSNLTYRFAAIAAVAGAAVSANAWILTFGGTYTNPGYNTGYQALTINYVYSDLLGNNASINNIQYSYVNGVSNMGELDASSVAGGILDLDFSGLDTIAGGTHTFSGAWIANFPPTTANTAATGTYSANFDGISDFQFTFVGQNAVPEPAAYGVMAMGLGGLLIRRRKRS